MKPIKEMNKQIFHRNMLMAIGEVINSNIIDESKIQVIIKPILEEGKPLNSKDDIMRSILLSDKNIKDRRFNVQQAVELLASLEPFVPIWIDVSLYQIEANMAVILLETSLRCRKPSILRNVESGHPPFRSIIND